MAITAIAGNGSIPNGSEVNITPSGSEEWNISVIVSGPNEIRIAIGSTAGTSSTELEVGDRVFKCILTSSNYLSLYSNSAGHNYTYSGYKKT